MEDKKSLNANAAAFVPNIKAKEFVPSFGKLYISISTLYF